MATAAAAVRLLRRRVAVPCPPMPFGRSTRPRYLFTATALPGVSQMRTIPPLGEPCLSRGYSKKVCTDESCCRCRRCCCCCCCCCCCTQGSCWRTSKDKEDITTTACLVKKDKEDMATTTFLVEKGVAEDACMRDAMSKLGFKFDSMAGTLVRIADAQERTAGAQERTAAAQERTAAAQERTADATEKMLATAQETRKMLEDITPAMTIPEDTTSIPSQDEFLGTVEAVARWFSPHFDSFVTLQNFLAFIRNPEVQRSARFFYKHSGMDDEVASTLKELRSEGATSTKDVMVLSDGTSTNLESKLYGGEGSVKTKMDVGKHGPALFYAYYFLYLGICWSVQVLRIATHLQ